MLLTEMKLRDRYEVLRRLGQGGAGTVFLVRDRIWPGRPLALKRIATQADVLLRASFEREFAVLAAISLPGVGRVMDFGLAAVDGKDPGGPFFTRTFVDGSPLGVQQQDKPSVLIERWLAVLQVVAPLHRMGVAHGDLKPGNIIIDRSGAPHIIDFGLSSLPSQRRNRGGTLGYMAPELLNGGASSVEADVYALGATLWTLLTGHVPLAKHREGSLARKLAGELPRVPSNLTKDSRIALSVALRALAFDPLSRLANAAEFLHALEKALGRDVDVKQMRGGFVAPKPRGHEHLIARLDVEATRRIDKLKLRDRELPDQVAVALVGGSRSGKTTLLRELKWRLQVRGIAVLESSGAAGPGLEPLALLVRQCGLLGNDTIRADAEELLATLKDRAKHCAIERKFALLLSQIAQTQSIAILVDDLDRTERFVVEFLRNMLHSAQASSVFLLVTLSDEDDMTMQALGAQLRINVPALGVEDVAGLLKDTLGMADIGFAQAAHKRTEGEPGKTLALLHQLSLIEHPTKSDIARVRITLGETQAAAKVSVLTAFARVIVQHLAVSRFPIPRVVLLYSFASSNEAIDEVMGLGLCEDLDGSLFLCDRDVVFFLRDEMSLEEQSRAAKRLLDAAITLHSEEQQIPSSLLGSLAVTAADEVAIAEWTILGAEELENSSAKRDALELYAALAKQVRGKERIHALLEVARLAYEVGMYDEATVAAFEVSEARESTISDCAQAAILAGRALNSAGDYDGAVAVLANAPEGSRKEKRVLVASELAKSHLKRGDYDAAERAAELGLRNTSPTDLVRVELLTTKGMVESYRGNAKAAAELYQDALTIAQESKSKRDQANVMAYLAINEHRNGNYVSARTLFAQSMAIAESLEDVGSMATFSLNLGAMAAVMQEPAEAAKYYSKSARLARRAGKSSTDVFARSNLANLHIYLGLYEQAGREAEKVFEDATHLGMKPSAAQARALLADVAARNGDDETAIEHYNESISCYRKLGQLREVADVLLDEAEFFLDREGPMDSSTSVSLLAEAHTIIDDENIDEFRTRLRFLSARACAETGDVAGAVSELERVLSETRNAPDQDLEWKILASIGALNSQLGADFAARRRTQEAMEVLESIAVRLPRELRESFWHDPRRRLVRARAGTMQPLPTGHVTTSGASEFTFQHAGLETRVTRLLDLIRRLASEHEVDRLLERITDSAVELTGAERGFVLLVNKNGQLSTRTAREVSESTDPHFAFSQSIAEAVLIDGEPVITMDAGNDQRLAEYTSVHKLMLKSVACLPIRSKTGILGVLYLEHRMRKGRFEEADVDLLFAFADQAAIALMNARLMRSNERRTQELEMANQALADAKGRLEQVLLARTEQLEEAKREVEVAREVLNGRRVRHGIVGTSPSMRKVFSVIDRVCEASVPVVIQGESGTGKELVARAIHYSGTRKEGPFVAVNCAAIPDTLLESELFGHVRGAFTGADRDRGGMVAKASGGTLFLDEVGDMPTKMQVDLLRVLQEGVFRPVGGNNDKQVDIRVISASNKALKQLVKEKRFREDLFYRLNVVELSLPAIRERKSDIPLLVEHFLGKFQKRDGMPPKRLSRDALKRLTNHSWPGNVRQLEHVLLNAWVLVPGNVIEEDDLALEDNSVDVPELSPTTSSAAENVPPRTYGDFKNEEKEKILRALEVHGWNRAKAAKALDMPRRTFYRRLKQYNILEERNE